MTTNQNIYSHKYFITLTMYSEAHNEDLARKFTFSSKALIRVPYLLKNYWRCCLRVMPAQNVCMIIYTRIYKTSLSRIKNSMLVLI